MNDIYSDQTHDYSCFICSVEGEQCLSKWNKGKTIWDDTGRDICNFPSQSYEDMRTGCKDAYLFSFNENPIIGK